MQWFRALSLLGLAAVSTSAFPLWTEFVWPVAAPPLHDTDDRIQEATVDLVVPRPEDPYLARRHDLEAARQDLAARQSRGERIESSARTALATHLPALLQSWIGTRYSYSGTSQVPRKGKIACGYYVSTTLEHAGFTLDRVDVARQASEQIIRSVIPEAYIRRFRGARRAQVVDSVEAQGPGVYLVGLDTHIGFLLNEEGDVPVQFCHSTRRRRQGVVCEEAVTSPSLKSRYTVLGRLDNPASLRQWLTGDRFVTAVRGHPQPAAFGGRWTSDTKPAASPTPATAALLP